MATDKWMNSIELLESIKLTSKPTASAYSVISSKAFDANQPEIGWQMLRECVSDEKIPKCEAFQSYIRWCHNTSTCFDNITKMLQFIGQNNLVISRKVVNDLEHILTEYNCHTVSIGKKYIN